MHGKKYQIKFRQGFLKLRDLFLEIQELMKKEITIVL